MTRTAFASALALMGLLLSGSLAAKEAKSPPATATVKVSGKEVKIAYSAPSVRGRKVFGELVPLGEVWRTGANAATALTTDGDIAIGGLAVPKGSYTLYSLPSEGGLTLIVNRQTGQWGTEYDAAKDVGRVEMKVEKPAAPVEQMRIELHQDGADKARLVIAWSDRSASVDVAAK